MKITKEDLYESLVAFAKEFGRYPSKLECKEREELYGSTTYLRGLGPLNELTILQDVYSLNPNKCSYCNNSLSYEKRNNKFCNRVCSGRGCNRQRVLKTSIARAQKRNNQDVTTTSCLNCGENTKSIAATYCSPSCQSSYKLNDKISDWLVTGRMYCNKVISGFLKEIHGNACAVCGITEWNGKPITFEVEHKDGDSDDSSPSNVCLICPNCHSQTPTYKGRNRGNGRHARRTRYHQGKSY